MVADGDTTFDAPSKATQTMVQRIAASRWRLDLSDASKGIDLHFASVPVRYAKTPVETVDARDVDALAALVASWVGLPPLEELGAMGAMGAPGAVRSAGAAGARGAGSDERSLEVLKALAESYGVAGHEAPVREALVKRLPAWCKPTVDERDRCLPFLEREIDLLGDVRVVVVLGGFAYAALARVLAAAGSPLPTPRPRFGHGVEIPTARAVVVGCYHPSQQNTFTGKLTEPMIDEVFLRARALAGAVPSRP